jgi:hypothetical protein
MAVPPYTTTTILRQLLGNPSVTNVKEELLEVAISYGDGQMEMATDRAPWATTDAYYGAAVGIAYKFAQAWALTGSDVDAEQSELFDEAMKAAEKLKGQLAAIGSSSSVAIVVGGDEGDNVEYFRCSPYGPGGGGNPQSYEAIHGFF